MCWLMTPFTEYFQFCILQHIFFLLQIPLTVGLQCSGCAFNSSGYNTLCALVLIYFQREQRRQCHRRYSCACHQIIIYLIRNRTQNHNENRIKTQSNLTNTVRILVYCLDWDKLLACEIYVKGIGCNNRETKKQSADITIDSKSHWIEDWGTADPSTTKKLNTGAWFSFKETTSETKSRE